MGLVWREAAIVEPVSLLFSIFSCKSVSQRPRPYYVPSAFSSPSIGQFGGLPEDVHSPPSPPSSEKHTEQHSSFQSGTDLWKCLNAHVVENVCIPFTIQTVAYTFPYFVFASKTWRIQYLAFTRWREYEIVNLSTWHLEYQQRLNLTQILTTQPLCSCSAF